MASAGLTWEAMEVGLTLRTQARTISETDIVNFVNAAGFIEPLFLDMTYVTEHTPFGRRIAPGLLTLSMAEGLVIQSGQFHATAIALLSIEVDVKAPVFAGDTISVHSEVVESRPTRGSHDRGVVTTRNEVWNQSGDVAMEYRPVRLIRGASR